MLESISGTYAFEVPRNWKQTPTIFWLLPAWSSELETGMSHFFGVARSSELETGMSHFFGVARVEFRVEFPGSASTCPGQVRRNFRQWSTGQLEKKFAEVVGLDNLDIFFAGKNSPWRGLGRAPMPGRRGRASMPGSWGLAAIGKKKRAAVLPPREDWNFFPGKNPDLASGSLLYVLYVLYLTRQATEHPLSPGSLLYVLYVLYLTRQATEHPLSPGCLLYVLYVLYGPI